MKKYIDYPVVAFLLIFALSGCKKFLDEKPNQSLATIETLQDMQALIDNSALMNYTDAAMGEAYGDNYFITDAVYSTQNEYNRNMYTFAKSNVFQPQYNPWTNCYNQINVANTILETVEKYSAKEQGLGLIKAQALFFRGKAFYNALTIWCMPYNSATAANLPGVPLRLNANFNEKSERATIAAGYAQAEQDLKQSILGLSGSVISVTRPSKGAAYGMLSRLYLQMRNYELAGKYADSSLQVNSNLLDYNTVSTAANFPMPKLNTEVVFESRVESPGMLVQARALISPELYNMYHSNDLRKMAFFKPSGTNYIFKGSYETAAPLFNGITTAEMYLTRAECYARAGEVAKAIADVNLVLNNRYKKGSFNALMASNLASALALIKQERRKELAFRSMRWLDIRRYNEEGDQITINRTVDGKLYTLLPQSTGYAVPIPDDIISLTGMAQN